MYKTKSRHRNINMKSTINTISTITTSDFISDGVFEFGQLILGIAE